MRVVVAGTSRALGLSNELFVLGDSVVLTVLGQVAFMPVLVLAAKLCPEVRSHANCLPLKIEMCVEGWPGFVGLAGLPGSLFPAPGFTAAWDARASLVCQDASLPLSGAA